MAFLTVTQFHVLHAYFEAGDFQRTPLPFIVIHEMANLWRERTGFGVPGKENISRGTLCSRLTELVQLGFLKKEEAYYTATDDYETILRKLLIDVLCAYFGENLDLASEYFIGSHNIAGAIQEYRKRQSELGHTNQAGADETTIPHYRHLHRHLTGESVMLSDKPYRAWKQKAPESILVFDDDIREVGFAYNDIPSTSGTSPQQSVPFAYDSMKNDSRLKTRHNSNSENNCATQEIITIMTHRDPLGQLIPGLLATA